MPNNKDEITMLVLQARDKARTETDSEPEPELTRSIEWPINCTVGPGLEGAICCETKIGYVNGSKGWLIYRGYDIFDLCAHSNFEEVSYLLIHGAMPTKEQFTAFDRKLKQYRHIVNTQRLLLSFPVEKMSAMSALRLGTNLLRQDLTNFDLNEFTHANASIIATDEDSIPMETRPQGAEHAIYEFQKKDKSDDRNVSGFESAYHLIAGVATIAASIARIRQGKLPIEPDPDLSHSANFLYMMTGKKPTPIEERIMDICLILHADHGMNASTFASMVVASTLSDIYFSIGAGIGALNGPLHGGANEQVVKVLNEIGSEAKVKSWYADKRQKKEKIMGFGHRVYKAYDPRARVLEPLAEYLSKGNLNGQALFRIAKALEHEVVSSLGTQKKIFPNVDFYSGIVYTAMGISAEMFTPIFAVSRVSGWTARVLEYLENNRIFRPRAMYIGEFEKKYEPIDKRI
jgi:citrate synthase